METKEYPLTKEEILLMQESKAMQRAAYYLADASSVTKIPIHELMNHISFMALNHINKQRIIPEPKPPRKQAGT
jgi:hypothetical protein